ncbi:PEP-CTERM sorting domain-containing protein [Lacipirellula sp.]|uniref:PEP-CTERM sorting domain-containing protein n=1 Tax=Lacipirellula sp. TaxID=2691419 RepID=UPI003D0D9A52
MQLIPRWTSIAALAVALLPAGTSLAGSAQLYSWEAGLEGWTAANVTLANSPTLGVTDGAQSLLIDNLTSGFKNDAGVATVGSGTAFAGWSQAATAFAGGATDVKLEFDFSWDNTNATTDGFAQLGMFLNSTTGGYTQYGTGAFIQGNLLSTFPILGAQATTDGVTLTSIGQNRVHVAVPFVSVGVGPGSFFQIGFKSNGGWGGTTDWAIDNMKVTSAAIGVPEPSSVMIAGIAATGLVAAVRRRRSAI